MAPRYSIMPGRFAADSRPNKAHMQVLMLLGRHTDNDGWCVRSQIKMAAELGLSRETVNRSIGDLVAWGYVQKTSQDATRRSVCFYRVLLDTPHPPVTPDDIEPEDKGDENDASGSVENLSKTAPDAQGGCDVGITGGVTSEITGGVTYEVTHNVPCLTTLVKRRRGGAGVKGARSAPPKGAKPSNVAPRFADVFDAKQIAIAADDHPDAWAAWLAWAERNQKTDPKARMHVRFVREMGCRTLFVPTTWPPGSNRGAVSAAAPQSREVQP